MKCEALNNIKQKSLGSLGSRCETPDTKRVRSGSIRQPWNGCSSTSCISLHYVGSSLVKALPAQLKATDNSITRSWILLQYYLDDIIMNVCLWYLCLHTQIYHIAFPFFSVVSFFFSFSENSSIFCNRIVTPCSQILQISTFCCTFIRNLPILLSLLSHFWKINNSRIIVFIVICLLPTKEYPKQTLTATSVMLAVVLFQGLIREDLPEIKEGLREKQNNSTNSNFPVFLHFALSLTVFFARCCTWVGAVPDGCTDWEKSSLRTDMQKRTVGFWWTRSLA